MSDQDASELLEAEHGISDCSNFSNCKGSSGCELSLSSVSPGDRRRGSRNPQVMIITEAPDRESSEGTAYTGGSSTRLISLFCDEKYGIGMSNPDDESFPEFLENNRFYATSAIKCFIQGNSVEVGNYVVNQCRKRYLDKQIKALNELELLIPMGKTASSSILRRSPPTLQITSLIGKEHRGIIRNHDRYGVPVVLLPHPSGRNPYANPPVLDREISKDTLNFRVRFQNALKRIRELLDELGYDVLRKSPKSWDSPSGLSDFL